MPQSNSIGRPEVEASLVALEEVEVEELPRPGPPCFGAPAAGTLQAQQVLVEILTKPGVLAPLHVLRESLQLLVLLLILFLAQLFQLLRRSPYLVLLLPTPASEGDVVDVTRFLLWPFWLLIIRRR
ncbi:hypothetical protein PG994_007728 [Apiospora phragmitis]|uniref:Uncharacterized protein n=1 Tax=Apiospora phragmitis TaxID=2905665 RepID=A0ABR1UR34_9PEZI